MIVNSTTPNSGVQSEPENKDAGLQAAGDFNTFLTLLTAQMRNQDPLKPMDSTEFVAQLASFSAVEQQIQANEKLDKLIDLFSASAGSGLAEWIGKDIRVSGSTEFNGTPVEVEFNVDPNATSAKFVVETATGEAIYEQNVDASTQGVIWRGETFDPTITAPAGSYSVGIVSVDSNGVAHKSPADVVSPILEIRNVGGKMVFVLENGQTVSASDIVL